MGENPIQNINCQVVAYQKEKVYYLEKLDSKGLGF